MNVCKTIETLRTSTGDARKAGKKIAFVPTMGNLHQGHLSLVDKAKALGEFVVVSIFVNPLQFGANEDLDNYPRTEAQDQQALNDAGVDCLFLPSVNEMYPIEMKRHTTVSVPEITRTLCGASRPGHFDGVSTVVTKLFNIVQPDVAVFGEKDFQQLAVVRKMVRDLCIPVHIVGVPTARAEDGLALSSRNGYLSLEQRQKAPTLFDTLNQCAARIKAGERDFSMLTAEALERLRDAGFDPDYFAIRDAETLGSLSDSTTQLAILVAASLGNTRLIDNVTISLIEAKN